MTERCSLGKLSRADAAAIAALCLLLILLVPVLFARPWEQAVRQVCAANLAQIGKAMLLYANDYEDELPRAGGRTTVWGAMPVGAAAGWLGVNRWAAYGLAADGSGGTAGISSCLYLLVKYFGLPPRVFICRGDKGTTEFKLSDYSIVTPAGYDLVNLWDFGPPLGSSGHCSYSYHSPFGQYALTTSDDPNLAVVADRNPWIIGPGTTVAEISARWATPFVPDILGPGVSTPGTSEQARAGNSLAHQSDGQNVLFLDSHVEFAKRAFCSLEEDNIYTISTLVDRGDLKGTMPVPASTCSPRNRKDSVLVQDPYIGDPFPPARKR
jgi:hypothetical protein